MRIVRLVALVLTLAGLVVALAGATLTVQPAQAGCTMRCGGV